MRFFISVVYLMMWIWWVLFKSGTRRRQSSWSNWSTKAGRQSERKANSIDSVCLCVRYPQSQVLSLAMIEAESSVFNCFICLLINSWVQYGSGDDCSACRKVWMHAGRNTFAFGAAQWERLLPRASARAESFPWHWDTNGADGQVSDWVLGVQMEESP